ncbi:uncharacterized protein [Argopecten irradians]|uniref:uncharacterized protein n=1 Tax=Argopecten irradians TaxID=31199 RepID=UPI00371426CA
MKANIYLQMQESTENFETELCWLLEHLQKSEKKKKMIIYVRSINLCYRIFLFLTTGLMDSNYFKPGIVEMFHANMDKETKEHIMKEFVQEGGEICVLVSTVAFGMGVNIPDVDIVVHWGLPSSGLAYWQEVGKCGRDGRCSYAICYAFKRSITKCEDEHLKKAVGLDTCLRISVLKHFQLQGTNNASLTQLEKDSASECSNNECVMSLCCSVCHNMCCCNNKDNNMLKTFLSS